MTCPIKAAPAEEPAQQTVSLCGKWAPYPYKSFDKRTLLAEGIARRLFPADAFEPGLTERQYAYRARDRFRWSGPCHDHGARGECRWRGSSRSRHRAIGGLRAG